MRGFSLVELLMVIAASAESWSAWAFRLCWPIIRAPRWPP